MNRAKVSTHSVRSYLLTYNQKQKFKPGFIITAQKNLVKIDFPGNGYHAQVDSTRHFNTLEKRGFVSIL